MIRGQQKSRHQIAGDAHQIEQLHESGFLMTTEVEPSVSTDHSAIRPFHQGDVAGIPPGICRNAPTASPLLQLRQKVFTELLFRNRCDAPGDPDEARTGFLYRLGVVKLLIFSKLRR